MPELRRLKTRRDFLRVAAARRKGVRPGHRLTYLQLRVLEGDGPSYVDDIELIERLPR